MAFVFSIFKRKKNNATKAERVYYRYCKDMYWEAIAILKSGTLAEDAVHLAMERIIKNLDKIDEADFGRSKNFCCVIAHNEACRLWAKEHKIAFEKFEEVYACDTRNAPLDALLEKEKGMELAACVDQLPPIYRNVMVLKFYNDLTNSEIARALHITEATVRKRYERAKKLLREMMEKEAEKYEKY